MRGKFLHGIGALILTVLMFSGVILLSTGTTQARHKRVVVVPEVSAGRRHHRHHHHRHYRNR